MLSSRKRFPFRVIIFTIKEALIKRALKIQRLSDAIVIDMKKTLRTVSRKVQQERKEGQRTKRMYGAAAGNQMSILMILPVYKR